MSDIKRLKALKLQALKFSRKVQSENPLRLFEQSHVSESGLTYSDLSERLKKIESCGSIIELKETWQNSPEGLEQVLAVSAANYCKQHAVCPVCADRSQSRRRARFNDAIKGQASMVKEKKRYAYIVTYTINGSDNLAERLEHLKESKRSFRLQGQKRKKGRSLGESGKIKAAISTIEIKRGDGSGKWHVHAHELAFTDEPLDIEVYDQAEKRELSKKYGGGWIPKEELTRIAKRLVFFGGELVPASKVSEEWLNATGDSIGISVERMHHVPKNRVRLVNGKLTTSRVSDSTRRKLSRMTFEDSITWQSKEVLKYPYKVPELYSRADGAADALTIIQDTYNKRLVSTYGEFRNVPGNDFADPAAEGEETFILKWNDQRRDYVDLQPGKIREELEEQEEHKARSQCGRLTGEYRRQRRRLVSAREIYSDGLSGLLDDAKGQYRAAVRAVWSLYRQAVDCAKRVENTGCDKYSPVLALDGCFLPGSDRRDVYAAVF